MTAQSYVGIDLAKGDGYSTISVQVNIVLRKVELPEGDFWRAEACLENGDFITMHARESHRAEAFIFREISERLLYKLYKRG